MQTKKTKLANLEVLGFLLSQIKNKNQGNTKNKFLSTCSADIFVARGC